MLVEIARPVSLLLCLSSLYSVFYAAFFLPGLTMEHRLWLALELLVVAAGVSVASGLLFRDPTVASDDPLEAEWRAWRRRMSRQERWPDDVADPESLLATPPIRVFCWATSVMCTLFLLAWHLETFYLSLNNLPR